ncbi:MAG: aminopeptidase P family N-terminal domain-containing protein, partial [Rhabdochlamydiaceae bacterium]
AGALFEGSSAKFLLKLVPKNKQIVRFQIVKACSMKQNLPRLQKLMNDSDIDLLIISAPENVFYLSDVPTSFTNSNHLLFCSRRSAPVMCVVPQN